MMAALEPQSKHVEMNIGDVLFAFGTFLVF